MGETETIAIVGAGQAGGQMVQSLRQGGYAGRVVLIGDEPFPPYQRPPLSKQYLAGEMDAGRLVLLPPPFFTDNDVESLFGVAAASLDVARRRVVLGDGNEVAFDKLVIATGSRSRPLPVPGGDLDAVYSIRAIADVDRLGSELHPGRHLVIIGGGYIGLEVAAIVRSRGLDVSIVEAAPRVMSRTSPVEVSIAYERLHRDQGVTFHLGAGVQSISRDGSGQMTVTTSDTTVPADLVLAGIGGVPNTELAERAGLDVVNGIVVDAQGRTSSADIFAIGDCATFPSARYGARVRLESVQNAIDHAKAIASVILGSEAAYDPVPWFWSNQYGWKYQIAGLNQFGEQQVVRGDADSDTFSVAHVRDGQLMAMDAINQPRDYMHARRLIASGARVDMDLLSDVSVPLNEACIG